MFMHFYLSFRGGHLSSLSPLFSACLRVRFCRFARLIFQFSSKQASKEPNPKQPLKPSTFSFKPNHGPVPVPILPEGGRRGYRRRRRGPAPVAPQVRHGRVGPRPVRWVSSAAHVQGENLLCACIFISRSRPVRLSNQRIYIHYHGRG